MPSYEFLFGDFVVFFLFFFASNNFHVELTFIKIKQFSEIMVQIALKVAAKGSTK